MQVGRLIVAALLAALCFAPAASAHEDRAPTRFGTVAFSAIGMSGTLAERTANYHRLYHAGVDAVRYEIKWCDIEPRGEPRFDFDFTRPDLEVKAITDAGLDVIGLLAYGHPDHSEAGAAVAAVIGSCHTPVPFGVAAPHYFPPDDPEDFARYARATAEHYGDEVIAWEIWNEENEGWRFWPPREDPAAYADLLCAAGEATRSVDPQTPVVFGGVFYPAIPPELPGMSGPDFVRAAHQAHDRLGDCYDVLAYHPYPYPFTAPELDVPIRGSVLSAAEGMREAMPPADRDRPLWITEIGWPTHDRAYGVSEDKQAQYAARMQAATFAQDGVPVVNWYTYGDYGDPSGGFNQEAHFGFFRTDNTAKPAYEALRVFARVFGNTRFARDRSAELGMPPGELMAGGRGFALEYSTAANGRGAGKGQKGGRTVTALWYANESAAEAQGGDGAADGGAVAGETVTVELPVERRRVRVVDYMGESRLVEADHGVVTLEVGPEPQYVIR